MSALAFGPSVSRALGVEVVASNSSHATCPATGSPAALVSQMRMPMPMSAQMHAQMDTPDRMPAADPQRPADPAPSHHSSNLLDCCALCAIAASPMAILAFALPEWQPDVVTTPFLGSASGAALQQRAQWPGATPRGPPLPA